MSFQHRRPHPIHGDRSLQQRNLSDDLAEFSGTETALALGVGVPVILGIILLPSLVIYPWIIGYFKPEWSYGKRVAAGLAGSIAVGAVTGVVKAAAGSDEPQPAAPTTAATGSATP